MSQIVEILLYSSAINMSSAPIGIFAYNRPYHFQRLIDTLSRNPLYEQSDIFIFIDGARDDNDLKKQHTLLLIAQNIKGARSVTIFQRNYNMGLAQSIINGVSSLMAQYGKAIVLEDDLVVSPSFLSYMNEALDKYEAVEKVFQISAFGLQVKPPHNYPYDAYFHIRAHSWGWASWRNRWERVDWKVESFSILERNHRLRQAFNRGGSDLYRMLNDYMQGKNNSWYIRFTYAMFCRQSYCVTPIKSLTRNEGFGAEATHCHNYNRYKTDFRNEYQSHFRLPDDIVINTSLVRQSASYYSIWARIKGKIFTILRRHLNFH